MTDQSNLLPSAPKIYANGIGLAFSKTDCSVTFLLGGDAQITVLMPFALGKSLAEAMDGLISEYERQSHQSVQSLTSLPSIELDQPK
jgi:hypothetical protein